MMRHLAAFFAVSLLAAIPAKADPQPNAPKTFAEAVQQVVSRPVYRHGWFGLEVYSLDTGKPVFALNGDKLFIPGSTTKLFTEGAALKLLGADYRFHTPLYRTGRVRNGTLKGDLIVVGSGDPNISDRVQPTAVSPSPMRITAMAERTRG